MGYQYIAGQRQQAYWGPTCLDDQVGQGHLARFIVAAVAGMDTSVLHTRRPGACPGRRPFDPVAMFCLVLYAFATGVYSCRAMEAACRSDLAFRYLSGGLCPDHATFARFLADRQEAMAGLFVDGLELAAQAGMVDLDVVAVDGTKMAANAALRANHTREWIDQRVAAMVAKTLAGEAAKPDSAAKRRGARARKARLARAGALIESQDAAEARAEEVAGQAAMSGAEQGRRVRGHPPRDPAKALAYHKAQLVAAQNKRADYLQRRAAMEERAAARGWRAPSAPPSQRFDKAVAKAEQGVADAEQALAQAAPTPARDANVTDADSRKMFTRTRGYIQGYNVQVVVSADGVILAQVVVQDANDYHQLAPMLDATDRNLATANVAGRPKATLADTGYWTEANAQLPVAGELLIATLKSYKQRQAARQLGTTVGPPPEGATLMEAMEHKLRTKEGAELYARRSCIVEPVFGQIKEDRSFTRFHRRGLAAVRAEFSLVALAHNLRKLFDHKPTALLTPA